MFFLENQLLNPQVFFCCNQLHLDSEDTNAWCQTLIELYFNFGCLLMEAGNLSVYNIIIKACFYLVDLCLFSGKITRLIMFVNKLSGLLKLSLRGILK